MKYRTGRLAVWGEETWNGHFEDSYNVDTEERVAVDMCGFDSARNSNYFEGDKLSRNEGEMSEKAQEW